MVADEVEQRQFRGLARYEGVRHEGAAITKVVTQNGAGRSPDGVHGYVECVAAQRVRDVGVEVGAVDDDTVCAPTGYVLGSLLTAHDVQGLVAKVAGQLDQVLADR